MSTFRQLIRLSVCCTVGVIVVCLLYVFNVPTYRVDVSMTSTPLTVGGRVLNQTCSHKMNEIEWLQYMKYMTKLHRGKLRRKQPVTDANALKNMKYTFSFVEGSTEGCLAVFMKEYLFNKLTHGGSHFRVEIDSKYSINLCSVDDYSDGTYHILCPVRERCSSLRIILMYVNNTAYNDVNGSQTLQKRILKKLYCWDRHGESVLSNLFGGGYIATPMKKTPRCFIKSQGFVSWVQDKYHNMRLAVDKCEVQSMPYSHFFPCTSNTTQIIFIGGESVQVYYRSILRHLKLTNDSHPAVSKNPHHLSKFSYKYADTPKAVASELEAVSQGNLYKTLIVFGGWNITSVMLSKNASTGNLYSIKSVIKKVKDPTVNFVWMPYVTMVRKMVGKKSRTCCHGNDFAYLPVNFRLMKEFGALGVDTFDVAYYASRIQSCNTIYKSRGPCKPSEAKIPYAYVHHAVIDAFLHYVCSMSHGLPVRRYTRGQGAGALSQKSPKLGKTSTH